MEIVKGNKYTCENCKKEFIYKMKYPSREYGTSLCRECIKAKRNEKVKATCLERYGNENFNNRESALKTINEKYGDWDTYVEKRNASIKETIETKYCSSENYQKLRAEKISSNLKEFYKNDDNKKDALNKRKSTNIAKYGVESTTSLKEVQDKIKNSKYCGKDKKDVDSKISEKRNETMIKKYGSKASPKQRESAKKLCSSEEFKEKRKRTCLRKYGTPTYLNNFGRNSFKINGQTFDSLWELAYFIWLQDHNIEFIFKPKGILYKKSDGSEHYYYPDFYTDHYIEIKGDHLIKNGKLVNYITGEVLEEKTECLIKNNVEILTSSDIKPIIKEIELKYGKSYLSSMRCING